MGIVSYQGIHYEGKHPTLIEPDIWPAVQDVLAAHNHTGEKDRVHNHYLRSTIYCSSCGGRLIFSQNRGRGGIYRYFMCVKKKTKRNNCTCPAVRAVPQDLLAQEMNRLTRELAEADTEIATSKTASGDIDATLSAALQAASRCQAAYLTAPNPIRRQINQGFKKLFIGEDGTVERAELTEPFAALLDTGMSVDAHTGTATVSYTTTPPTATGTPLMSDDRSRPSSVSPPCMTARTM